MALLFEDKQKSKAWYSANLKFPAHLHRAVELGIVLEGQCQITVEGQDFFAHPGDLFLIFPNQIHSYADHTCKTLMCTIPTSDLKVFERELCNLVPTDPVLKKGAWETGGLKTLIDLLAADFARETEPVLQGYYQAIVGKCLALLPLTKRQQASDDLRQILSYINEHCTEEISRSCLAKAVGISERAVSHIFSEMLKMSLPEYLRSIRLGDAAKLLQQTKLPVTEIAGLSGFGSIRSFNRAFLEHFHVSPSAYRQSK